MAGFVISAMIELMQFSISYINNWNYRVTDVDDLILNVLGTIIGFLLLKATAPLLKNVINTPIGNIKQ